MTRNAEAADMARRAASGLLIAASMLAAVPAVAGDRALVDFIGYSADGQYFAFEEYGEQDGSGFPYSTIYIVDLEADKWVGGSPYRVVLDDDGADVEEARDTARENAGAAIDEFGVSRAAYLVALNGDGDSRTGDGHELGFGQPGYGLSEMPSEQTLILGTFPRDPGEDCSIIDDEVLGFSLSLDGEEFYADGQTLPKSRGCPMGYKIYGVVQPADWSLVQGGKVAIISFYPFGFEGPDRRFLVVPLPN